MSAVGTLAVPVGLAVAVDDVALRSGDGQVRAGDHDRVEVAVVGVAEGLGGLVRLEEHIGEKVAYGFTGEDHGCARLQPGQVDRAGRRGADARQQDVGARGHRRRDGRVLGHRAGCAAVADGRGGRHGDLGGDGGQRRGRRLAGRGHLRGGLEGGGGGGGRGGGDDDGGCGALLGG